MADSGTVTRWERRFLSAYLVIFALLAFSAFEDNEVCKAPDEAVYPDGLL